MKKISLALAAMMMAVLFVFAGCGENTAANPSITSGETTADSSRKKFWMQVCSKWV